MKNLPITMTLLAALCAMPVAAEENERRGSLLKPDVDEPPEEIYEPLHGIGHQQGVRSGSEVIGSEEIEQSRKLREQAEKRRQDRLSSPEYQERLRQLDAEVPIADGTEGPPATGQQTAPPVRRQRDGGLSISDPDE